MQKNKRTNFNKWFIIILFLLSITFLIYWKPNIDKKIFTWRYGLDNSTLLEKKRVYLVNFKVEYWRRYVMQEFYFLFSTLINKYGWQDVNDTTITNLWKLGEWNNSVEVTAEMIPDVIIFWEDAIDFLTPDIRIIQRLQKSNPKLKLAYYCDDLHNDCAKPKLHSLAYIFRTVDVYIGPYAYRFHHYFQNILKHLKPEEYPYPLWIPHSASPAFTDEETLPFRIDPIPKLFLAGAINHWYPYRLWLNYNVHLLPNLIVIYPHPGYTPNVPLNQTEIFASNINKYLASFTCGLTVQYVVSKVFEITASGSLLMMNSQQDELMKALGFFPQVHYYNYSALDPLPDIKWVFQKENRAKVDEMRRNGMIVSRSRHRTSMRADAVYEYFHRGTVTYEIPPFFHQAPCPNVLYKDNCKPKILE